MEIGRKLWLSLTVSNKPILEGLFIIVLLSLTGLSIGTPRSSYNSININYEGPQEIIERYLDLEISEYFGGIEALGNDSCSGFNAFKVSPNYLGSTERSERITPNRSRERNPGNKYPEMGSGNQPP